jgi:hypothetical protein
MNEGVASFLFYLGVGKVFIFLIQTFAHSQHLSSEFLKKLLFCDLCLGFWTYLVFSIFLKFDLLFILFGYETLLVGNVVTAGICTFVVHIFSIGWNIKFHMD